MQFRLIRIAEMLLLVALGAFSFYLLTPSRSVEEHINNYIDGENCAVGRMLVTALLIRDSSECDFGDIKKILENSEFPSSAKCRIMIPIGSSLASAWNRGGSQVLVAVDLERQGKQVIRGIDIDRNCREIDLSTVFQYDEFVVVRIREGKPVSIDRFKRMD
jgi:hypothetical protein